MVSNIKNIAHKKFVWIGAIFLVIVSVLLTVGIHFANAGAGGGWAGGTGGHAVSNQIICRNIYYDKWDDDTGEPVQGWGEDSIDYFWDGMYYAMGNRNFATNSTGYNGYDGYYFAAREALVNASKDRADEEGRTDWENIPSRVVGVAWIYTIGSDDNAYGAWMWNLTGTDSSADQMMPAPGEYRGAMVNGTNGKTEATSDWKMEEYSEQCQIPGYTHMTIAEYIHHRALKNITGKDENGNIIDGDKYLGNHLQVIVIAVAEGELNEGSPTTLVKHITGYDSANGSFVNNLYKATQGNGCYDLAGAQFTLYDKDGTVVQAKPCDSSGKQTGNKINVVFTIKQDGSTDDCYLIKPGDYYLKETKAPNIGYLKDSDGDGIPDEERIVNSRGKAVTIEKVSKGEVFELNWSDPPMKDPTAIFLYKRDSLTGGLTAMPEGNATMNGAQYRFSYYKGVYKTVDQLPGYNRSTKQLDYSQADTTAIWTTRSYVDENNGKTYTGKIDFGADAPTSGTWKYTNNSINYCPLGTLVIQEVSSPEGYNLDERIYLYSLRDDGTHLTKNIVHTPWNKDGSDGSNIEDRDWNDFCNNYELNGDRDDVITDWS